MKSTFYYLVTPLDGKEFSSMGKHGLILGANIEDHRNTQRLAKVIGLPKSDDSGIQEGDVLLVHHNTFRTYYDMKGRARKSANFVKDKLYYVEPERIYMHIRGGQENVFGSYSFVKPVQRETEGFQFSTRVEKELVGEVALIDDRFSKEENVVIGDVVTFTKDSEYEFRINDERYYRVPTKNIVAVL